MGGVVEMPWPRKAKALSGHFPNQQPSEYDSRRNRQESGDNKTLKDGFQEGQIFEDQPTQELRKKTGIDMCFLPIRKALSAAWNPIRLPPEILTNV
jgi:hypothetical protein